MEFIIIGLILILVLYIVGIFVKRKYYKEMDRLEAWKIDIMNRPMLEELSKVKQLNMTGETEKLFEKWRSEWDEIAGTCLPDVEEHLFDAEEYIDKYRFKKAGQVQSAVHQYLTETEEKIQKLVDEINELVGSEEKNRTEIEELKEIYRLSRKNLLAHRHNYGRAEKSLETKLDDVSLLFDQFEERTENGDYLKARETVLLIKSSLHEISHKMEIIPDLLIECQSKIPSQLNELKEGYEEMAGQGYVLKHIPLHKEIAKMQQQLELHLASLEKAETDEVVEGLEEIRDNIHLLYDLLEEEVHAKQFVFENKDPAADMLQIIKKAGEEVQAETKTILKSYHLPEEKLEEQNQFEKRLDKLRKQFELLEHKIVSDKVAYTLLRDELSNLKKEMETLDVEIADFSEKLKALRKDELAAREKVQELSQGITEAIKTVRTSNIPGVPESHSYLLRDAGESIHTVKKKLEEQPLDIPAVQKHLEIASAQVEKAVEQTYELIETAVLAEKVIQYGNRYRSRIPSVRKGLEEAEQLFREFEYQSALERAATCIEEVEPGALKRIEQLLTENE